MEKLGHLALATELFGAAANPAWRRAKFSRFAVWSDEAEAVSAIEALRQRFPVEDAWQRGEQHSPTSAVDRAIELVDEVLGPAPSEHPVLH